MSEVLFLHKKDGYLNEMYVDNNEEELDQEGFYAIMRAITRDVSQMSSFQMNGLALGKKRGG